MLGFRESAKSTIATVQEPVIEGACGTKKFIIVCGDTDTQAQKHLLNIRFEFENNKNLIRTFGDMRTRHNWGKEQFELSNGTLYLARSRGQKVRGLRHGIYRPDLLVVDDIEDIKWVQSKRNRDDTERWFNAAVSAIDKAKGRVIVCANHLHTDALAARLKKKGTYTVCEYPLMEDMNNPDTILWKAKYPDMASIEATKKDLGYSTFMREMMLKAVPEDGQPIKDEDIHYYDEIPKEIETVSRASGVDPAISLEESADPTAIVNGQLGYIKNKPHIILRSIVNEHLAVDDTLERLDLQHKSNQADIFFVEDVAYQKALIQLMQRKMLPVEAMHPGGRDKRARLMTVASYIKDGTVLFPRTGMEDLIIQLTHFGVEAHDDLVDALVYLILGLAKFTSQKMEVEWLG